MSPYLHVALRSFQRHLAYRAANLAGIVTNLFFGAVYVFIYVALFRNHGVIGGLDVRDTVTYAVITQALLMSMSAFGNRELSEAIIKGEIATDLCRPLDFYLYWGAIDVGRAVYYLIFRALPTYFLGLLIFRARGPAGLGAVLGLLAAVGTGMLLSFAFRFIASSLAFWTTDSRGINYLVSTVIIFFSGFIVPLNFFPPPLRAVAESLPFSSMAHLPVIAYLGKIPGTELLRALVWQALWFVALTVAGRLMLRILTRRLTVHGG